MAELTFYLLMREDRIDGTLSIVNRYDSYNDAKKRAEELAKLEDRRMFVLKAVSLCYPQDKPVVWVYLGEER